jgi:uncharacterized Zn finger protein (UPF0148 family)
MTDYLCIKDKNKLINRAGGYICPVCDKTYKKIKNIPIFVDNLSEAEEKQREKYNKISVIPNSIDFLVPPTILNHFARQKYMDQLKVSNDA